MNGNGATFILKIGICGRGVASTGGVASSTWCTGDTGGGASSAWYTGDTWLYAMPLSGRLYGEMNRRQGRW